jgi:hypothetical protein
MWTTQGTTTWDPLSGPPHDTTLREPTFGTHLRNPHRSPLSRPPAVDPRREPPNVTPSGDTPQVTLLSGQPLWGPTQGTLLRGPPLEPPLREPPQVEINSSFYLNAPGVIFRRTAPEEPNLRTPSWGPHKWLRHGNCSVDPLMIPPSGNLPFRHLQKHPRGKPLRGPPSGAPLRGTLSVGNK